LQPFFFLVASRYIGGMLWREFERQCELVLEQLKPGGRRLVAAQVINWPGALRDLQRRL
jgi:hypothetical protein